MNENNKEGEPLPRSIRVLWVDDQALTTLAIHQEYLEERIGGKIEFVLSARKALEILEESAEKGELPDVVVSDFSMPLMNGLEFAREVRNHSNPQIHSLPFCVFTGLIYRTVENELRQLGIPTFKKVELFKEISKIRQIYESAKEV